MAEPLGQVVFKVPELGKMGYELELRDQAMQEKKAQKRDAEVYRTGGEKAYSDNIYKLQGRYKDDVELLYNKLEEYGTRYEQTGDASALRMVNGISSQIKGIVNDYNTQVGMAVKGAQKADAAGWNGFVGDRALFDERMSEVLNPSEVTGRKFENGQLLYQINGQYVPRTQTDYGSQNPNNKNTVLVQEASKLGKFVVPSYYESENKYMALNATSVQNAQNSLLNEFRYEFPNNPELQADVAVAYAISRRNLDPKNISVAEMNKIVARIQLNENGDPVDPVFRKEALEFYEGKLSNIAVNRYASKSQDIDVKLVPMEGGGQQTVVDSETPVEEGSDGGTEVKTNIKIPETKFPTTAQKGEKKTPEQTEQPQFGPPSPEQVIEKAAEEIQDVELEDVPEAEEEFDSSFGISEKTLDVVKTVKGGKGERDVVRIERTLPDYYTNNLLDFEGGKSTKQSDAAYEANPDAPVVNGERVHTNIGVTWNTYKSWAKSFGIPESEMESRFLNLKPNEALAVAEHFSAKSGANNFKNPALAALYTQNAWAGGTPFLATKGSNEYRALSVMLEKNGVKLDKDLTSISADEATQITALFEKNPQKFIDDYFDAYMISHSRMSKTVKDGNGNPTANWDLNKRGWYRRANEFKKALAEQLNLEFKDIDKSILDRKYKRSATGGFRLTSTNNYWDNYQPIS